MCDEAKSIRTPVFVTVAKGSNLGCIKCPDALKTSCRLFCSFDRTMTLCEMQETSYAI